jgi:hypothetical protein
MSTEALGIDAALAADGLDELLTIFLPTRTRMLSEPMGHHVVALLPTDDASEPWFLELADRHILAHHNEMSASASVQGSSVDLYLFGWNRKAPSITISGDTAAIIAFENIPR